MWLDEANPADRHSRAPELDLAREPDFVLAALRVRPSSACVEAQGRAVRVQPKVMEVLILLAQAKATTVSRNQLAEACWAGRVVSEDAMTRVLGKVRRIAALTNPPAFRVETLTKVGVRLIVADASPADAPG
jgi:DNA-binding winged helix-turn-helix (wHTH) protein